MKGRLRDPNSFFARDQRIGSIACDTIGCDTMKRRSFVAAATLFRSEILSISAASVWFSSPCSCRSSERATPRTESVVPLAAHPPGPSIGPWSNATKGANWSAPMQPADRCRQAAGRQPKIWSVCCRLRLQFTALRSPPDGRLLAYRVDDALGLTALTAAGTLRFGSRIPHCRSAPRPAVKIRAARRRSDFGAARGEPPPPWHSDPARKLPATIRASSDGGHRRPRAVA
jgi:hypothetical protein